MKYRSSAAQEILKLDLVDSDIDSENGVMRIYRYITRTGINLL